METECYSVYCEGTANDNKVITMENDTKVVITMENDNKGSHNYGKWQ